MLRGRSLLAAAWMALVAGCDGRAETDFARRDIAADPARLAAARPYLGVASGAAAEIVAGTRPCLSPVPGFPGCEHDRGQLLLLAAGHHGGAGSRVDALLWVPAGRRPRLATTL